MSDFLPRDIIPDLLDEILKRHWSYVETEEGMQKLEERKKLDVCLKEFLCVIPHERKFFLPETAHVLRKSIREMDDFSAYKAIIGFESISQYANNLFTKPWRKEFRVLKMYSGFFQHEIKSKLLDAEKLFEAMGYRRLSDEVLILDGPICPDQVTNVSRDAMIAFVECQIIEHIYGGLSSLGIKCSWQDVYHYREKNIGGTTQAVKAISHAMQERRLRKEKLINVADNCYATIQHAPQVPSVKQCQNCAPYHHMAAPHHHHMQSQHQQPPQCAVHHGGAPHQTNAMYNGPSGANGKLITSYPAAGGYQYQSAFTTTSAQPHMSHSRSLEQYSEPTAPLPHRHSFDHQQQGCTVQHYHHPQNQQQLQQNVYESPYDCIDTASIDGGSSVSYAAVGASGANYNANSAYTHAYNAPGNRVPLPFNISSQLNNSHYATPTTVNCNGVRGNPYASVDNSYAAVAKAHNCNYHAQPPMPPMRQASSASAALVPASKDCQAATLSARHQRSFPPDQLIDFDERAPLVTHDIYAQRYEFDRDNGHAYDPQRLNRYSANMAPYAHSSDTMCHHHHPGSGPPPPISVDDMYAYPVERSGKAPRMHHVPDKYLREADLAQDNNCRMQTELKDQRNASTIARRKLSTHTNDRDPFDDFVTVGHSEHPQSHSHSQRSPTQATKNQDGVGSFESWDYVFQNLDRSGYSKDLGERGDLLVQSLNIDSLNLADGGAPKAIEKRRTNQVELKAGRQVNAEKAKTLEKVPSNTNDKRVLNDRPGAGVMQEKSILKPQHNASGGGAVSKKPKSALKSATPSIVVIDNNNGNAKMNGVLPTTAGSSATERGAERRQQSANAKDNVGGGATGSANSRQGAVATPVIVSNPNEWSCRFCTFLNPDTKRVCEICCRSKNLIIEATASHTPTCV